MRVPGFCLAVMLFPLCSPPRRTGSNHSCGYTGRIARPVGRDQLLGTVVQTLYEEIPQLNALDAQYAQVTVLGVNYDGASGAVLEQQRQKLGVQFASLAADPAAQLGTSRPGSVAHHPDPGISLAGQLRGNPDRAADAGVPSRARYGSGGAITLS